MSLNWNELEKQTIELAPKLESAIVQKISRTRDFAKGEAFIFTIYTGESTLKLVVALRQELVGIFLAPRVAKIQLEKEADTFVMVLRKYLVGKKISNLFQVPKDRMIVLEFQNEKALLIELIPRKSNLILFEEWSPEARQGKVLGNFRRISLATGALYKLIEPQNYKVVELRKFESFQGRSYEERVADFFYRSFLEEEFENERKLILKDLRGQLKKINTAIKNNDKSLKKTEEIESIRKQANVLQEKLYEIGPKNFPEKKTEDIQAYSGEMISVHFDLSKNYAENNNSLFQKIKKLERGKIELVRQQEELEIKFEFITNKIQKIESCESLKELRSVQDTKSTKKGSGDTKNKLYIELKSSDGFHIYCGRNQKENREVTFKMARGNDMWLHIRGEAGSHVVVRGKKNKSFPLQTLLEAAHCALYYSKVRKGKKAEVDYTLRKYVKAIKGKIAEVNYTENKTLYIELDTSIVKKLLQPS